MSIALAGHAAAPGSVLRMSTNNKTEKVTLSVDLNTGL